MTAIEEMAGMDVLCCDKTGTLTLNSLTVDKNLIEVPILRIRLELHQRILLRTVASFFLAFPPLFSIVGI